MSADLWSKINIISLTQNAVMSFSKFDCLNFNLTIVCPLFIFKVHVHSMWGVFCEREYLHV